MESTTTQKEAFDMLKQMDVAKQALLSYCYLDVFAMTRIIEELQELVSS